MLKTIWVTNKSGHDFSPAEKFGRIEYLTEGILPSKFSINMLYRMFTEKMANAKQDDYILMSGPSSALSVAVAIMAAKHGIVNLLIHDTKDKRYEERSLVLERGERE